MCGSRSVAERLQYLGASEVPIYKYLILYGERFTCTLSWLGESHGEGSKTPDLFVVYKTPDSLQINDF